MENKILHIIPEIPKYKDDISKIDIEERDNAGLWYLHGSLENMFHFDKAIMTNCKTLGISKPFIGASNPFNIEDKDKPINKLYYNGEIDCEVEGCDKPCIAFLYTRNETSDTEWIQRGLVCLKEDEDACNYARNKMKLKSCVL